MLPRTPPATAPPAVPQPLPPDRIAPPRPPTPAPIAVLVVSRELMPLQPASPASTTRTNPLLPNVRSGPVAIPVIFNAMSVEGHGANERSGRWFANYGCTSGNGFVRALRVVSAGAGQAPIPTASRRLPDRKSTRLNSSH